MAKVRVYHRDVTELGRDFARIPRQASVQFTRVTRKRTKEGAKVASWLAYYSANRHRPGRGHGKHYWRSIKPRMLGPTSGEWGPLEGMQSNMSFEEGSRKQPPHRDMHRSADLVVPKWWDDIDDIMGSLFWPGGVRKW